MAHVNCSTIGNHLAAFHLGQSGSARAGVEAHLLGCRDCLAQYLETKHAFDLAAASTARPDPAIRRRLRAHFRFHAVPYLLAGFAAAAALAAFLRIAPHAAPTPVDGRAGVDSASIVPLSLGTL